jgi:glycosyltransferase involved in cell wall biosynthesis
MRPQLSVIVPAHGNADLLAESLAALHASDLPRERWELIVVDDASGDDTPEVAARYADTVIRLGDGPRGPAYARNRGSEVARGEILVYVDADVRVHPDTLRRFAEAMMEEPRIGAVFGAYDTAPRAPGLVSQYRNLLHHYVHARHPGDAATFWAGCGAVRRAVFRWAGGFDAERYPRPQVEDIALGYRIRELGYRILLRPEIQATHLKRWTLRAMMVTDLRDRGIPWMRLLLQRGTVVGSRNLNLRNREKVYTVLTVLAMLALLAVPLLESTLMLLIAGACLLSVVIGNAPLLGWFARVRSPAFALGIVPLRLLYYLINAVAVGTAAFQHLLAVLREATRMPAPADERRGQLLGFETAASEAPARPDVP